MSTQAGKLNRVELSRLAELYHLEQYLFEVVSLRFKEERTLSPYDFYAIVTWKANRAKTKVKKGLAYAGETVASLMHKVIQAPTSQTQVEILTRIDGIGLPMASAILTVCYPDEFTVLDYRVWETLGQMSVDGLPARRPRGVGSYLQYCQACRQFANKTGLSLRDLDRALWAKSWEDDLFKLIDG